MANTNDAEMAKALDDFAAILKTFDSAFLVTFLAKLREGLAEGRPGNYAGMIEQTEAELSTRWTSR